MERVRRNRRASQFNRSFRHAYLSAVRLAAALVACVLLTSPGVSAAEPFGLNSEQAQKLKALGAESRKGIEAHRCALRTARGELAGVYAAYRMDDRRALTLIGRISRAQKGLLDELYESQVEIRKIMNAEQFKAFSDMVRARTHGVDVTFDMPMLPVEDEAWEKGLAEHLRTNKPEPSQEKYAKVARWVAEKKPESISRLRKSSQQLGQAYLKYELDATSTKKLLETVHRDQVTLTWMMHKRQQSIRGLLSESEFQGLKDDVADKVREARSRYKRPDDRSR